MRPTLRNGLVLVGDVVILAGGRLAHEAVKGLTAGPKPTPPTWVEFVESVGEFKGGARPELASGPRFVYCGQVGPAGNPF